MAMDLRVLVGVFITLFGIAVGMAGGDIQSGDLRSIISNADFQTPKNLGDISLPSIKDFSLDEFLSGPKEADNGLSARIASSESFEMNIQKDARIQLRLPDDAIVSAGQAELRPVHVQQSANKSNTSNMAGLQRITIDGFTGTVSAGENISFDGRAKAVQTSAVTLNYSRPANLQLASGQIENMTVDQLEQQEIVFKVANATISSGSSDLHLEHERAKFEAFEGTMHITQLEQKQFYQLEGDVYQAVLRSGPSRITLGGENN